MSVPSRTRGEIVTPSAQTSHGRMRVGPVRSQRERGWTADPTLEGLGRIRRDELLLVPAPCEDAEAAAAIATWFAAAGE